MVEVGTLYVPVNCRECGGTGQNGTDGRGNGLQCRACGGDGYAVASYAAVIGRG